MEDEREAQDLDAEAAEDLELEDEAEDVTGGVLRSNPDAGGQFA